MSRPVARKLRGSGWGTNLGPLAAASEALLGAGPHPCSLVLCPLAVVGSALLSVAVPGNLQLYVFTERGMLVFIPGELLNLHQVELLALTKLRLLEMLAQLQAYHLFNFRPGDWRARCCVSLGQSLRWSWVDLSCV